MKPLQIFIVILFVIFASCKEDKTEKLQKMKSEYEKLGNDIKNLEKELKNSGVEISDSKEDKLSYTTLSKTTFNHYIEVQGRIDGDENVIATSKAPGVITKLYVKEGDVVRKGQLLAEMDAGYLYPTLEEIKLQLDFANDLFNKQKELWDQKIGSEVQYLSAKNNKESLENRIKTLNEQIDMYKIFSPGNGTVEEAAERRAGVEAKPKPSEDTSR